MDEQQAFYESLSKSRSGDVEQSRDINILAASSRLTIVKEEVETQRLYNGPPPDFKSFVGKTFIKRIPGIYVGATYEVRNLSGDQFLVARNDPATGTFEYTITCKVFHELMKLPSPPPAPNPPPPTNKKPSSPWEKDK